MATYSGTPGRIVLKDGKLLSPEPSQKLWNHSLDGFNWGYGGSGPAQLALGLLYDVTGDKDLSVRLHQDFKWAFVAKWGEMWEITTEQINEWVEKNR
jgi:hypothetical protein